MSKFFVASRMLVMLALLVLIIACFWGWAHRDTPKTIPEQSQLEGYDTRKPGPVITAVFIASIFLGLIVVALSVWIEYKRVQGLEKEAIAQSAGTRAAGDWQNYNL